MPRPRSLLLLVALLLGAAACSGGDPAGEEPAATQTTSAPSDPSEDPADPSATPTPEPTQDAAVDATPTAAEPTGTEVAVQIAQFAYSPETLEIAAGDTVVWTNTDQIYHSVTAGTPDAPSPDVFDGDTDGRSDNAEGFTDTYSRTFAEPGEFAYFCTRHPTVMTGTVVVS